MCDSSRCLHPQPSLRPSPAEVSACLWADSRLVRAIVSAVDGDDASVQLDDLPSSIRYHGFRCRAGRHEASSSQSLC